MTTSGSRSPLSGQSFAPRKGKAEFCGDLAEVNLARRLGAGIPHRSLAGRERSIVARLSPFFNAEQFAAQFGTQQARDDMLAGLKAAGFP